MIKVVLIAACGAVKHSTSIECLTVTDSEWEQYTDDTKAWDHLSEYAWEFAVENARAYGFEPESYREFFDSDEDCEFTDDISGYFEVYNPEVHDKLFANSSKIKFREL